jgi:stress-induced morphogen
MLYHHCFQLCFRICHYEGPGNLGWTEIKWDTSASGLCWWCKSTGDNIGTIEKYTETLIDASKEVGLEINIEKTKHMLLSRRQKAGQNWDIKIVNRSFENVSQLKYLGTTVINQNLIQEEIKRRLSSGKASYHSVQSLLSSRLLSKNLKMRVYKTIILLWFCMGAKSGLWH